jgi:hypothetical protein
MKLLYITIILLLLSTFNTSQAALPPGSSNLYFACVHQEIIATDDAFGVPMSAFSRKKQKPKTYLYAYIDIVEDCPPFTSDYAIPENEVVVGDDVIWGQPEVHIDMICGIPLSPICISPTIDPDVQFQCDIERVQSCNIHGTGHDCRGGYVPYD